MSETTVEYQIRMTRTGAGASEAAAELKGLSTAAAAANTSVTATTPAMNAADNSAKAAGKSFEAMKGALGLVAGQAFPQLTSSIMVAKSAVDAMRASNTNLSVGFATLSAGIIGITALLATAATAWSNYAAEKNLAKSEKNLSEQESDHQKRLTKEIDRLKDDQSITTAQARALKRATGDSAGNTTVRDFLRQLQEGNAQDQIATLRLIQQLDDANIANKDRRRFSGDKGKAAEIAHITEQNVEMAKLLDKLQSDGLMTLEETDRAKTAGDIAWLNRMADIKQRLTEVQKMGQQAVESFAGGFSAAFVSFLDGTKSAKEAFTDFARSFLSQMAQMILQQLMLNAIKGSSFGKMLGFAEGGVKFAANGLAGVSSVSSPTYFPKFNVVAGEAGREMMTVLARPRMMEVGGMQAVVGSAQGQQLAITSASDLAGRGGAGGTIVIQVQGTADFEARVIQNSVKGAVVQVAQDMRQDTAISRGVKGLTA